MIRIERAALRRPAPLRGIAVAVLAAGAALSLSGAAHAQFAFEDEVLPPRVVTWRLADRGFTDLSRPRFNGRVYVVDAVSPSGAPVRLLVDPAAGAIVGQQRLGAPETYARLERPPAPGFGWTEEDAVPRRIQRPIPSDQGPALRLPHRPAGQASRPEGSLDGLNPDEGGRTTPPPRKVARAAPDRQPELRTTHRDVPAAPKPKSVPSLADTPAATAKGDPAGPAKDDAGPAAGSGAGRSAAIDKAPAASPAPAAAPATAQKAPDAAVAAAKPAAPDWKDPPGDRKPVRVIGGATVVPGTSEKEPAAP